jgi:hypothetical protein
LKFHFIIIIPSMPMFSKCSLSFMFHYEDPVCTCPLLHMCYILRPSNSLFDNSKNILWGVTSIS